MVIFASGEENPTLSNMSISYDLPTPNTETNNPEEIYQILDEKDQEALAPSIQEIKKIKNDEKLKKWLATRA